MCEKRKRQGQYLLSFSALCLVYVFTLAGCQAMIKRHSGVHDEKTVTTPTVSGSEDGAASSDITPPLDPLLGQAESHLNNGEYPKALDAVTRALADSENRDEVFYNRALTILARVMAHTDNPANDGRDAMACFDELDIPFPDQGPAAKCWLDVLDELLVLKSQLKGLKNITRFQKKKIQALEQQLEQLKAVDLELGTPETENEPDDK